MTDQDKQLLLKDLCARLPYGIICNITDANDESYNRDGKLLQIRYISGDANGTPFLFFNENTSCFTDITEIKPYLRPMSSMTEEEKKEFNSLINGVEERCINAYGKGGYTLAFIEVNDWLNAHHFDYRGLIPKGLALEAPKDMYNI